MARYSVPLIVLWPKVSFLVHLFLVFVLKGRFAGEHLVDQAALESRIELISRIAVYFDNLKGEILFVS